MNPFQPGQFLKAQDIRNIQDGIKKRIIEGKGIKVFSSGNQIIIEKKKIHKRKREEGLPIEKYALIAIFAPHHKPSLPVLDVNWNDVVPVLKGYETKDSMHTIMSWESVKSDWLISDAEPETYLAPPTNCYNWDYVNLVKPPAWGDPGFEFDAFHWPPCPNAGHFHIADNMCYWRRNGDPFDPVVANDEYWLWSASPAWSAWTAAFSAAVANAPSPMESYTYWYESMGISPQYAFGRSFRRWIEFVYNYTLPGDGLTEGALYPLPSITGNCVKTAAGYCNENRE